MNGEPHNEAELARNFLDPDYRRAWADDFVDTTLALQIAVLRRGRQWSQTDLADRSGTRQSAISRMEDVEYGAHSIRTLKQLAAAVGLRLKVSFEEFGSLIRESAVFSESGMNRSSFEEDACIRELLRSQGLTVEGPAAVAETPGTIRNQKHETFESDSAPDFHPYIPFKDEFDRVLQCSLGDRVISLQRWLKGYGLPSEDEPAYKALYYSIPADLTHANLAKRLGEGCAELLLPEGFAELLSDREDGETAAINLFRLSILLRPAVNEISASCEHLFRWLEGEWKTLDESVQEAAIDLASELGLVGEIILGWKTDAELNDRHRRILATNLIPFRSKVAAKILEVFISREPSGPEVVEVVDRVIENSAEPAIRNEDLGKEVAEKRAIAATHLNIIISLPKPGGLFRTPGSRGYVSRRR